jgi:hypothetical protein
MKDGYWWLIIIVVEWFGFGLGLGLGTLSVAAQRSKEAQQCDDVKN